MSVTGLLMDLPDPHRVPRCATVYVYAAWVQLNPSAFLQEVYV